MSLRDVTIKVEDGSLGNQNSTGENVHVKIGVLLSRVTPHF